MHKATIGENEEQVEKQEVAIGENVKQSEIQVVAIEENIKQSETKTEETIDTDNDLKQQRRNHIKQILYTILAGIIFYFGYKLRATVAIALIAAVIGLYCRENG